MIDLRGKKVLILKLRYIGDTLSIVPVAANLARKVPGIEVDVLVNRGTEQLLSADPHIHRLWAYDRKQAKRSAAAALAYHWRFFKQLRPQHYDVILDFTHGDRAAFISFAIGAPLRVTYRDASRLSRTLMNRIVDADPRNMHIVDYQLQALKLFGLHDFDRRPHIVIPPAVTQRVDRLLAQNGLGASTPPVAIHPGARNRLRRWQPERFAQIARRLRQNYGAALLLLGGPDEGELVDRVRTHMGFAPAFQSCSLNLLETAAILRRCRLFIGNDSAPAHIAAAVDCPGLTLFGPTWPHMWRPLHPAGRVVWKDVPCRACRQEVCIRPRNSCMHLISVKEVWRKVQQMMAADHLFIPGGA